MREREREKVEGALPKVKPKAKPKLKPKPIPNPKSKADRGLWAVVAVHECDMMLIC